MPNKVKYGLKNVHYAVATINATDNTATYETPVPWPGAVNFNASANDSNTTFRADNIDYWIGNANNGYEGDFESALIPDSFKKDVLGYIEDANGVLVEDANAPTVHFALLFQFEGDANATRHVLYNCTATRPAVSGATTSDTIEPQTETATIRAIAIHNASLDKDVVKASCTPTQTAYATWFESVYQATAPTP
jgi:phi13 family phage major tail protein